MFDATPKEVRTIRALGALSLFSGLLANPWFLARFRETGEIGINLVLFILLFDFCLVVIGVSFLLSKRKLAVFRTVLGTVSAISWIVVSLACAELYLAVRTPPENPYYPFGVKHLHPFYFFSLPSDTKELARINNAVVSVTPEGFRGPGPEQKGSRKLAFLVGGSVAFGEGATSDATTISGRLNEIQQDYHFVNAGVPSWNSTQEFYRVAMQLLHYKPDLIIVYDGFNDVAIDHNYRNLKMDLPPGTPESYEYLSRWVDDIRGRSPAPLLQFNPSRLHDLTFPRVRDRLTEALRKESDDGEITSTAEPLVAADIDRDAAQYLWSISNMQRLAAARGTRLVVFWQVIFPLHQTAKISDRKALGEETGNFSEYLRHFHTYVFEHRDDDLQIHDLGDLFDRYSNKIPLTDLFIDGVHLKDQGNTIVAREIWSRISQTSAP